MNLPKEQLDVVRAEAAAVARVHGRAEGKAQSKIHVSELIKVLNGIRKGDVEKYDKMAQSINRLGVMVDTLVDLLCDDKPLRSEGTADGKRRKFHRLCTAKAQKYGIAINDEHEPVPNDAGEQIEEPTEAKS